MVTGSGGRRVAIIGGCLTPFCKAGRTTLRAVSAVDLARHATVELLHRSGLDGSVPVPMLSPMDGEVIEVNREVLRSPGILSQDPYGSGWLLKVRSPRIAADTRNLLSGKLARAWMESALERLQPIHPENLGPVLQDGGLPVEGIARALAGEQWAALARTHLLTDGD